MLFERHIVDFASNLESQSQAFLSIHSEVNPNGNARGSIFFRHLIEGIKSGAAYQGILCDHHG